MENLEELMANDDLHLVINTFDGIFTASVIDGSRKVVISAESDSLAFLMHRLDELAEDRTGEE